MVKKAKKPTHKTSSKMTILPKKMSSLIGIALKDIRKAEKFSDKFIIDMATWYDPERSLTCRLDDNQHGKIIKEDKVCVMCAAGSVLAFSLGAGGKFRTQKVKEMETKNMPQLNAIDALRIGSLSTAVTELDLWPKADNNIHYDTQYKKLNDKMNKLESESIIPEYDNSNPEPFHAAMKKLQTKLVKAGL